jgi:hypothetical protein
VSITEELRARVAIREPFFYCRQETVIATFDSNARYGNHLDGRSHAAIYPGQDLTGIRVLDQWNGHSQQPVHERIIRFGNGVGPKRWSKN